jgi:hypothetical protein
VGSMSTSSSDSSWPERLARRHSAFRKPSNHRRLAIPVRPSE